MKPKETVSFYLKKYVVPVLFEKGYTFSEARNIFSKVDQKIKKFIFIQVSQKSRKDYVMSCSG